MEITIRLNLQKIKLTFLAEKSTNIVLEYTKKFGMGEGLCFLRKNHFVYIFIRKL